MGLVPGRQRPEQQLAAAHCSNLQFDTYQAAGIQRWHPAAICQVMIHQVGNKWLVGYQNHMARGVGASEDLFKQMVHIYRCTTRYQRLDG